MAEPRSPRAKRAPARGAKSSHTRKPISLRRDRKAERDRLRELAPKPPLRQRRSLEQHGGAVSVGGDEALSGVLREALEASAHEPNDDLTHGFHSYPARMHPAIASALVSELSEPGAAVLDPFVGSGTVLIEAFAQGRRGVGVDLNPLALRIAEVRCQLRDKRERSRFGRAATAVAVASEESVRSRAVVDVPVDRTERAFYDPHVILELSGLWSQIGKVEDPDDRRALAIVFSSLLVKFSRQRGDTSDELIDKRIRKGLVTEFFARKAEELVLRWEALAKTDAPDTKPPVFVQGDARRLTELAPPGYRADLVLTSPPYGGTYDYVAHHARRYAWLGLDDRELRDNEIGARRNLSGNSEGGVRWDRELGAALSSISAVLADAGRVVLWVGDAELGGRRIDANEQVARLGRRTGLVLQASAAQERPDFRGGAPRREHLLLLSRAR